MHTLKENDAVHCESKEQYDRIIDLAIKAGVAVYERTKQYRHWAGFPGLSVSRYGYIEGNSAYSGHPDFNWHTEGEFIAKLFGLTPSEPPIRIGEHAVQFNGDGSIKVGCTSVDYDTLKAVYERATKKRP